MLLQTTSKNGFVIPNQRGIVVWLFGLSGAGKTTISNLLKEKLEEEGFFTMTLDGDVVRKGVNRDLGFSEADRTENIRRAAEIARLMMVSNIITICSFITPLEQHRALAAQIIGEQYFEVFLDCPLAICKERDVKGLYNDAEQNLISNFTGVNARFEPGLKANLIIKTNTESSTRSMGRLFSEIISLISPIS